jgi:hypothetical protein
MQTGVVAIFTFVEFIFLFNSPYLIKTMFEQSFPPADAMVNQLSKIEYKKHWQQFVTFTLTVFAIVTVLAQDAYKRVTEWYQNGGKEQLISYAHRSALFINKHTGLGNKFYAALVSVHNRIELSAHQVDDALSA